MCDVALDPYTSHGHDGLIKSNTILNDETIEVLINQSLLQAEMGCDVLAPSDMMDGGIGKIRKVSRTAEHYEIPENLRGKIKNELINHASSHFKKGFDYMVCGHYHLNEIIDVGKGKLVVLGDWEDQPSYAMFNGKELTLHQWNDNA